MSRCNHRNLVRFEGFLWSEDRCSFYLLAQYCHGSSLWEKFQAQRQRTSSTNASETEAGLPNAFVHVCMQAVLDALEHLHVEIGIPHTHLTMQSVLFDRGRVRVGAPLPLSTYRAINYEKREQASMTSVNELEVAKANDVRDAGMLMLELCTGQTMSEHGAIENAMSCATTLLKDTFVSHAQMMVKEVPANRISASQAAWRMAQCVQDIKVRDSRFHTWRETLQVITRKT
jgi:hypothetical protein